jgi:hypothetical protein
MASSFPSSLDAFTNPSSTDAMDSVSVPHATQHADLNDAVVALEAKVGADSSAVSSSHDYKIAQLEAGATGGKILQVVSTTKTDTFTASIAAGGEAANVHGAETSGNYASLQVRLYRGATEIGSGATAGSRPTVFSANVGNADAYVHHITALGNHYLDSPATTSATTYALYIVNARGSTIGYRVNGSSDDSDAVNNNRTSSSITVIEVSA